MACKRCSFASNSACIVFSIWIALAVAQENIRLYFGQGCFWHIQYEFVQAEKNLLGRSADQLTSIAGYAGALEGGTFCYNDGKLHAEVVELEIPVSLVSSFAAAYWSMFVGKDRSHTNDRGPNYRAVIGLPRGMNSPLLPDIRAAQQGVVAQAFELRQGAGDDPDTLGSAHVWVYDSLQFPFQQAETYHQFHDDYLSSGDYPSSYNELTAALQGSGRLAATKCPNDAGGAYMPCSPCALLGVLGVAFAF
eukprot:gnl/TRDRNA2_/TRDRNA2_50516_c0_seq1.p1 gnl/TRDRNA2_/TRDRNA2_50516_c0~~gnl/TRDRNA2_/TRDRNA2_50516_c0_seq1.p1  ORF type:complete len:249 (+),score=18.11 gnl/TRDRNA2_/TRDRNA2_50516_c0_seq1:112-858(+)